MWKTNLKVLVVALVVLATYTGIAHVIPQVQSEVPEALNLGTNVTPEALVAAGERVFDGAGGCTACHGLGTRAPNLRADYNGEGTIGVRCGSRPAGLACKEYLFESLTEPGQYLVPGFDDIMPDMRRQLPEDQIWATVAYLQSLGGQVTVSAADLPDASASSGAAPAPAAGGAAPTTTSDPMALIEEKGCLACHAINGSGPPLGPSFDGMGGRLNADRIRRGILDPNAEVAEGFEQFAGLMPLNFGQQFTAGQLEALVQFLAGRK